MSAGEDKTIGIFEGPPYKFFKMIDRHQNYIYNVLFNEKGDSFVSVGGDKKVC